MIGDSGDGAWGIETWPGSGTGIEIFPDDWSQPELPLGLGDDDEDDDDDGRGWN